MSGMIALKTDTALPPPRGGRLGREAEPELSE